MAGFSPFVHSVTGDYTESLNDAKIATGLQPSLLKALVRGKSAMIQSPNSDLFLSKPSRKMLRPTKRFYRLKNYVKFKGKPL